MARVARPVEELSNSELILESLDRSTGTAAAWGCLTIFVGGLVLAVFIRGTASPWGAITSALCPAALIAMTTMLVWTSVATALRRRSSAPYRQEYLRRSGLGRAESASALDGSDAEGRAIVMLSGRALPHGGTRVVWLYIWTTPAASGELVHAAVPYEYASGSKAPRVGESALPPAIAAELFDAIAAAETAKDRPKFSGVRDGFPFSIEVHRPGGDRPATFTGNLAARSWRDDAGCRLADTVLRAADALGARREPYGACSDDGTVTLGDR